jgi:predicted small lipoprotein YifL
MCTKKLQAGTQRIIVLILPLILLTTACGFRGPLYLPEDGQQAAESPQIPASEDPEFGTEAQDDEEDGETTG